MIDIMGCCAIRVTDAIRKKQLLDDLCLYVFVIVSYDSMGRGRCAAQASHAANLFTDIHIIRPLLQGERPDHDVMVWRSQANGFGTQIVKAVTNADQLKMVLNFASAVGAKTGIVIDPEYPIPDGENFHIVKDVVTAGYAFGDKTALNRIFWTFPLLLNDPVNRSAQFNQ